MPEGKMLWAYRATIKQNNAGGGTVYINVVAEHESFELLYGLVGQNDYAADRNCAVILRDSSDNDLEFLMISGVDNEWFPFPVSDHSVVISTDGPELQKKMTVGKSDLLACRALSLVQNEELTITIRALISTTKPTITTTNSAGTVVVTEEYNKVI